MYRRRDRVFDRTRQADIERGAMDLEVAGRAPVTERDARDGVKLIREDASWLMFRFSGTEPVLRLYCEATSVEECEQMLDEAEALVARLG